MKKLTDNFQQVIKAVKMKKYSYGMNGDGFQTSNVVIKRAIRDIHFIKEDEDLNLANHFIPNHFQHQPIFNQHFSELL